MKITNDNTKLNFQVKIRKIFHIHEHNTFKNKTFFNYSLI